MITLVDVLESEWGLNNVKIIKKLQANGSREVIYFSSTEGQWIVKMMEPNRKEDEVQSYTQVLHFLGQLPERLSPMILEQPSGRLYTHLGDRFLYVMEYIDGNPVSEDAENEFQLGILAGRLHAVKGYPMASNLRIKDEVRKMLERFKDKTFYQTYSRYIHSLPDFDLHQQSLIHTDIGPHNAMKERNGQLIFIDLDDAGMGSTYIDIGFPLICQFVRFHKDLLKFDEQNAAAFYQGYQMYHPLNEDEVELTFQGALFMQMMYMDCFGAEGVDPMWSILEYALNHKELLKNAVRGISSRN